MVRRERELEFSGTLVSSGSNGTGAMALRWGCGLERGAWADAGVVVVGPEFDELVSGKVMQEGLLVQPAAGDEHPVGGQRDADGNVVGGLRAVEAGSGQTAAAKLPGALRHCDAGRDEQGGHRGRFSRKFVNMGLESDEAMYGIFPITLAADGTSRRSELIRIR
jgi:hypothetical protein